MKITPLGNFRFEKGDWVEISEANIPAPLKNTPKPVIGRVTNVDGEYVYVKPKNQKWEAEFYHGELLPIKMVLRKLKLQKINKSIE